MNSIGNRGPHRGVGPQISANRSQQHQNGRNVTRITSPYGNKSIPTPQQPSKAKNGVGKAHSTELIHFDLAEIRREAPNIYRSYPPFVRGETDHWSFKSGKEDAVFMIFKDKKLKSKVDNQYHAEGIEDDKGNLNFHPTKGEKLVTFLAVKGNSKHLWATR